MSLNGAEYPFILDDFQVRAMAAVEAGENVLVAAPTGSGKTVVALHALALARQRGQRAFYTTPIKALSNQKFLDLGSLHGPENVGLLTGDNVIRPDAPLVVMTTEVLRNMIYSASPAVDDVSFVVLDEVHYLQDAYRGSVWEEVMIHAPARVRLVCLSATVSNAEELASWIRTVRGPTSAIIETRRPVELRHHYLLCPHRQARPQLVDTLLDGRPNPEAARLDATSRQGGHTGPPGRPGTRPPGRTDTIEVMAEAQMLPAIYFIFSRAGCDDAVRACYSAGLRLTSPAERAQIHRIAHEAASGLTDGDRAALGFEPWSRALEAGITSHHAGMVPPFKQAVEAAFVRGLVKVVFATETLALGVNMPARAVVIERLTKFTGERHEFLTPSDYTQLTGRAGRRGIDELGHAVVAWSPYVRFDRVATLASTRSYDLRSSFRPTYNMAANLVSLVDRQRAHQLLNLSFAQYQADHDLVGLQARYDADLADLDAAEESATCSRGDLEAYWQLSRQVAEEATTSAERPAAPLAGIRPGDILRMSGGKSAGRVAVVSVASRRGGEVRLGAVTPARRYLTLSSRDFDEAPELIGRLRLPSPYAPRSPKFQRSVASALGRARVGRAPARTAAAPEPPVTGDRRRLQEHPVHSCPRRGEHLAAMERCQQLRQSTRQLRGRLDSRADSLGAAFDRIVAVLEEHGYVDSWELTASGRVLRRIYHECDLLVADAVHAGCFDGIDAATLAGLASTFTYEPRRPARGSRPPRGRPRPPEPPPEPWFPSEEGRRRWEEVARLHEVLAAAEDRLGVPLTRAPHPGFFAATFRWAAGDELAEILGAEEVTGGDFVRTLRQVIDLLRQLAGVCPDATTSAAAAEAARRLDRGVVAASSLAED